MGTEVAAAVGLGCGAASGTSIGSDPAHAPATNAVTANAAVNVARSERRPREAERAWSDDTLQVSQALLG